MEEVRIFKARTFVESKAEKLELRIPKKPAEEEPILPSRISDLSDENLGNLHATFVGWFQYCAVQLALVDIDSTCANRVREFTESQIMLGETIYEKYEGKSTLLKAYARVHPKAQRIIFETELARSLKVFLQAKLDGLEAGKEACSREITRRDQELKKRQLGI